MKKRSFLIPVACLPVLAAVFLLKPPADPVSPDVGAVEETVLMAVAAAGPEAPQLAPLPAAAPIDAEMPVAPSVEVGLELETDPVAAFDAWVGDYLSASSDVARANLEEEGIALAEARRAVMKTLIREDPRAAIEAALPVDLRDALPVAIQDRMERTVSGRGDLDVLGIVPLPDQPLPEQLVVRHFETEDAFYNAYVYGRMMGVKTVDDIFLHGIAIDQELAVNEDPVRTLSSKEIANLEEEPESCPPELGPHESDPDKVVVAETADDGIVRFCNHRHVAAYGLPKPGGLHAMNHDGGTYATQGEKTVLVIRVDFETPDGWGENLEEGEEPPPPVSGESVSVEDAYATMEAVGEFFQDASYRQFSFSAIHVTDGDPFRMPKTVEEYQAEGGEEDPETGEESPAGNTLLMEDAIAAAVEAGYGADYDFTIVAFPNLDYPWAGLGSIGAEGAWIQGEFSAGVIAHEVGHNFGLHHAGYWEPLGPVESKTYPVAPARSVEYGNVFDVMGAAGEFPKNHFSGNFKNLLGWLPDERVGLVEVDAEPGVHRIYRLDGGAALNDQRFYALQVEVQDHGALPELPVKDYWVDFRQLYTESERAMNGVVVQWGDSPGTQGGSHLLNVNQTAWASDVKESPLGLGETFIDSVNEVIITPDLVGGSGDATYIDLIVTRGRLAVELLEPEAEFSIDNPTGETTVAATGMAEFRASVTATGSPIGSVEFVLNGEVFPAVATEGDTGIYVTEVPTAGWPEDSALELVCVVRNEVGNEAESEPVLFKFVEPEIELTATPGMVVLGQDEGVISFSVQRTMGDAALGEAEIFVDDVNIGTTSGLALEWSVTSPGIYTAYATAIDENGIAHRTSSIQLRVYEQGGPSYTFPSSVMLGEDVWLAVDLTGQEVSSVQYIANGELLGEVHEPPFDFIWEPTAPGDYEVHSIMNVNDVMTPSPPQSVTVTTPALSLDVSPRIARPGEDFWISAGVDADSWQVTEVEYFVNGKPYTTTGALNEVVNFVPAVAGTHAIEVRARDKYGNEAVAATGSVATYAILNLGWSEPTPISFSFVDLLAGAAGNGRVVIGGGMESDFGGGIGVVYYSDDGANWIETSLPTSFVIQGLAYGNGLFVAVGEAGNIARSVDGAIWETAASGLNSHLRDVTFDDGMFVAVGDQGTILYSVNGLDWERATSPETNNTLWQSAYGNGRWLAVGQAGMILTSEDGLVWTAQTPQTTIALRGVTFGKGTFVAVGGRTPAPGENEGIILTSADGLAWSATARAEMLTSVDFAQYAFVATGTNGTILSSYDRVNWGLSAVDALGVTFNGTVFGSGSFFAYGDMGIISHAPLPEHATTYQDWLAMHLSAAQIEDFARIAPEASIQGAVPNVMRYAFGFDPWTPIPLEDMPHLVRVPGDPEDHFGLTYRLSTSATDLTIVPEVSTDLLDWKPLNAADAISVDHGHFEAWVIDDALESESDRRFFRLNIQLPW